MSETTSENRPEVADESAAEVQDAPAAEASTEANPEELAAKFEGQRKVNRDLERKLTEARTQLDAMEALKAEVAKLQGKESEYAAAQEQRRLKDEALSAANQRILKAEIRAHAAGKLADPQDALLHIDVSSFEVGDDGEVDGDAVASAISDLISRKPYLAVQDGKRFQGTADGGARNDAAKVGQLSEQDVKRLAAEGRHEEIVKAKAEGRLTDYLAS